MGFSISGAYSPAPQINQEQQVKDRAEQIGNQQINMGRYYQMMAPQLAQGEFKDLERNTLDQSNQARRGLLSGMSRGGMLYGGQRAKAEGGLMSDTQGTLAAQQQNLLDKYTNLGNQMTVSGFGTKTGQQMANAQMDQSAQNFQNQALQNRLSYYSSLGQGLGTYAGAGLDSLNQNKSLKEVMNKKY